MSRALLFRNYFKYLILALFVILSVCNVSCELSDLENGISQSSSSRDPKLFLSVSVPPDPCGESNSGVCYPRRKCARKRGTIGNMCFRGFGECCTFTSSCNATVSAVSATEFVTTLRAPKSISNQCSFRIKKPTPNVCQVKLDFQTITTTSADDDGICRGDRVTIKGSTTVPDGFTTCGALNGQHMYLSYGNADTIELIVVHMEGPAVGDYVIVATQIPCSSSRSVPENCLQYFDSSTGVVKSFDWGSTGQQQSNQLYTVCVKEIITGGSITWSPCNIANQMGKSFDISSPNPMPGAANICDRDWVQINGRDRICNGPLPTTGITSRWGPYLLNVNFDAHEQAPFPFSDTMAQAIDNDSCTAVQTAFPNLISSCIWDTESKTCQCVATPAANDFVGTPDFKNQGFCFMYSQS